MKTIQALCALCVLVFFSQVFAEERPVYCKANTALTTKINFVNGIWNTELEAKWSLYLIQQAYKQRLQDQYPDQIFDFRLDYNYHTGKVRDLIEVIGQKMAELNDPEVNRLTASQYLYLYLTARSFNDEVPLVARPITSTIEEYLAGRLTDAVNADEMIQRARAYLMEGARILYIAHSQGNMFATEAISALMGQYAGNIGMIGVASPADVVYNESKYFTADDDRVINALRLLFNVLPSNVDNDPGIFNDPRDFSNHQFGQSYFAEGLATRSLINTEFNNYIATLQFPVAIVQNGAITATLTWGSQPDMDLHMYEPEPARTHVYYGNRQGMSGFLDLDDTDGYGPEHIYVPCSTLETGAYLFSVQYFRGTGPETALIQIQAGNIIRSYAVPFTVAVGSIGDNSPAPVANVTVNGDPVNGYTFDIQGFATPQ